MKLSVIIPNFNDLRIRRAVESVRRQSHQPHELIIVDGGSNNAELLAYYDSCGTDLLISEKDQGIFDALNKGVRRATGDVLFLMGSDDELSGDGAFVDVASALDRDASLDGVCIGCEFVNGAGEVIRSWHPRRVTAKWMKRGILPPHFSLFLRKSLYDIVGEFSFREFNNVASDSLWLLDLAIKRPDLRIEVLPHHHLRMEYGGASTQSLARVMQQFRIVHEYARRNARHLSLWFLVSPLKTLSKVGQLRILRR
jgi:glycosyltransferase